MSFADKLYEKTQRDKEQLAKMYEVPTSAIVYVGNNKYIVVKDGKMIY